MKIYSFKLVLKIALLLTLSMTAAIATAQQNIFRAGNVKITSPAKVVYGSVADINDGNNGTDVEFENTGTGIVELLVECNVAENVTDYTVNYYYSSNNATTVALSGSQDNAVWTAIDSRTFSPIETIIGASVTNTVKYKYYKLVFSGISGASLDIKELAAYSDDPIAPVLIATPGLSGDKANVSWSRTLINLGSYELERSINGTDFTKVYTSNLPATISYEDTGLKAETSYWYRVRGINSKGPSSYSNVVKITTVDDILKGTPALNAVAGLVGNEVTLSWSGITINTAGQYIIEKSTDGTTFTPLETVDKALSSYKYTAATASTSYWFRIKAVNYKSSTPYSQIVKVTTVDDILKGTPVLTAVAGNVGREVILSWSGVTINTPGQFLLERSTDGQNFTLIKTADKALSTYTDTTATRNTNYWYRVKGVNYKSSTPYSNIAFLTTVNDVLAKGPVLAVVNGTTGQQVNISWSGLTIYTAGQFQLEKSTNGVDFTLFATVDKSISTYIDSTLTHATDYWFRIRGINSVAPSPYSNIVKVTTKSDFITGTPTLTAATNTGTNVNLSWALAFPTKGGFELEKSLNGTDFTVMGKLDKSITAYTEESLSINTSYWYRVRAFNYLGYSPYSATAKITTNGIKGLPSDITDDGGTLTVSADNSSGANGTEGSSKFIDNNVTTKWLVFNAQTGQNLTAVYQPKGAYVVTGYSLSTANDSPARDPKNWKFEGSDDNAAWTTLDTRTNQLGAAAVRTTTYSYSIATPGTKAYKYYRIAFSSNNGSTDIVRYQIAEWQILGLDASAPDIPANLATNSPTTSSLGLTWTQINTPPAKEFILQRSMDGLFFTPVDTIPGTTTSYTDVKLYDGATYYYRLKALGEKITAISGWSNVATGKTLTTAGVPLSPIDLKNTFIDDLTINLKWTDRSSDETGFVIERSRDNVLFEAIKTLPANTTTYSDATVWPGTYFYYRVKAINDKINSGYSNVLKVLTTGFNTPPLSIINPKPDPTIDSFLPLYICTATGTYNLSINGIKPGPAYESAQKLKVTGVKAGNEASKKYFSSYSFNPVLTDETIFNGTKTEGAIANFTVNTTGIAKSGDFALLMVTVKDDGGTIGFASDSTEFLVKVFFTALDVKIVSDKGLTVPRYSLVKLTAVSNFPANTKFEWENADGIENERNGINLNVRPKRITTYTLKATTPTGCTTTASITVSPKDSLVVANVLTPNRDGKNDTWMVWGIEKIPNNEVKVFDRQGRIVFTRKNYNNDWDGTYDGAVLPQGGYYYVINTNDGNKSQTGVLMIIK